METASIRAGTGGGAGGTVVEYLSKTLVFGLASVRLAALRASAPRRRLP
ncbi:hypothetical protein [Aeropyrum camini]|nr:hypothetical protein [Aeropyrum camini]